LNLTKKLEFDYRPDLLIRSNFMPRY
jgi:hypothetical protein